MNLQLIQNKGLRLVYKVKLEKDPVMNTAQLHVKSNCMFLSKRRDIHLLFLCIYIVKNRILC